MKRRMRLALWLYPPAWRARYAREFEALLEDVGFGWREWWDVLRGGLEMRLLRSNLAKVTMACALLGAAVGGGWSLRVPDRYISTAVIRVPDDANVQDLLRAQTAIFSLGSMAELIAKDDLFHEERQKMPVEDVISHARNTHIRVTPLATAKSGNRQFASTVEISFEYPDRDKAQRFTRAVTDKFAATLPAVQILDPASLPDRPAYPNRLAFTLTGLAFGVVAGILAVGVRRWPIVAASGFAAAAAALAIAYAIPDQWQSTAVLQIDPPTPDLVLAVLDDAVLQRTVEKRSLLLYPEERARLPIADVIRRVRENLTIRANSSEVSVSFRHRDRFKAQAVVREFVAALTEVNVVEARKRALQVQSIHVVAPATLPETPMSPNRLVILLSGLTVGLAAGILLTRRRRLRTTAAAA